METKYEVSPFECVWIGEALKLAEQQPEWLVQNMISDTTTLIYGEAKSGKSFLVSALIASLVTGEPFLGEAVPQDRAFSVAVGWTDDAGQREYATRIMQVVPEDVQPRVGLYHLPPMTERLWEQWFDRVMADGHNVVVVDNLSQALESGSINDDATVRKFFNGVRRFTRAGIPVIVVAHSSDKTGMHGQKPDKPMGSGYISQAVRWRVFVRRSRAGNMTLQFSGNNAEPYEMTLRQGAGARFDVIDTKTAEALKAKAEGDARARGKAKLDENAALREWLNSNAAGMSQRQAAQAYADKHGMTFDAARNKIRRSGLVNEAGTWEFKAA